MASFQAQAPSGLAVQQLEVLVRTAIFKPANALVGWLLQAAVDRADAAYVPKSGEQCKGREPLEVQGLFGCFQLSRDYYYHEDKQRGHYPADAALGLEGRACREYLEQLSAAFNPQWLSANVPRKGAKAPPSTVAELEKIPQIISQFRPVIERNRSVNNELGNTQIN